MKKKMVAISFMLIFAVIASGCGSSGGSDVAVNTGGGINTGNGNGTDTGGGISGDTDGIPETRLFFRSGSLSALDPANPNTPIQFETANTDNEQSLLDGTLNATNQQIEGTHVRSLVYANTDDGKLYEVSALTSDLLVPVRVSNETNADLICFSRPFMDLTNFNNGGYLYELPGTDAQCSTPLDNIWKMVRPRMLAIDFPIRAKEVIADIGDVSRAIIGYLAINGPDVVRCDANFKNCSIVITPQNMSNVRELFSNVFADSILLKVDNSIRHYKPSTNVLSSPLYTLPQGEVEIFGGAQTSDANDFFFVVGLEILKVPVNGRATATTLTTEANGMNINIQSLLVTQKKVVYLVEPEGFAPGVAFLKSISKTEGGTSSILRTVAITERLTVVGTAVDFIHYAVSTPTSEIRGVIKDNGTEKTELNNARWVGETFGSVFSFSGDADRIISIEGCNSIGNCASGSLVSFDARTNMDKKMLGTLPSDISGVIFGAIGNNALGFSIDTSSSTDIFYVNSKQVGSLTRVTNTPGTNELTLLN